MAKVEAEVGIEKSGFMKWIDDRFPFTETMKAHATEYYAAKNFNVLYVLVQPKLSKNCTLSWVVCVVY